MSYFLYLLCFTTLLCSCGGNATKSKAKTTTTVHTAKAGNEIKYVNSIKLISPEKNGLHLYNEELNIAFENKEKFSLDSAEIFIDGKKVGVTKNGEKSYRYKLPESRVGTTTIKVVAHHPEHKQGIATTSIYVKPDTPPTKYRYEIIKTLPHDPKAYTQGLVYQDGILYEGTGQYGESTLRKTDMAHGKTIAVLNIDNQLFGEGITIYKDKIYQITWRSRKGFIYDLKTFSLESTFDYNSEGWGITTAGEELIMSDGSNKLYHIAPATFNILKETEVYDQNGKVDQLNELEYVNGIVWANIWLTDRIVAIDPESGAVVGELDMSGLLSAAEKARLDNKDEVLNGIAYNPEKGTFYLTGKRWPKMFEIKISPELPALKNKN